MVAYDPGAVTSPSLEGALLQVAQLLQTAEQFYPGPDGGPKPNRVNVVYNTETNLATITATLPINLNPGIGGAITVAATPYINPGS